jgi:hypothetical protein
VGKRRRGSREGGVGKKEGKRRSGGEKRGMRGRGSVEMALY